MKFSPSRTPAMSLSAPRCRSITSARIASGNAEKIGVNCSRTSAMYSGGPFHLLYVFCPDLHVLGHVEVPVLVRWVQQDESRDVGGESLGEPLNVGTA